MPSPDAPAGNSHANGSTPSSDHNGFDTSQHPSSDRLSAMAESKEKAKVVMAAGLQGTPTPTHRTQSNTPNPQVASDNANNSPLSRKRSRSGSRKSSAPPQSSSEPTINQLYIDQYTTRDQINASAMINEANRIQQQMRNLDRTRLALRETQQRTQIEAQRNPPRIKYPSQRKRFADRRTSELRMSRHDRAQQAEQTEELVPIRLDLEFEKLRLRDTFTWNIHDRVVPPMMFAQGLIEDFKVPPEASQILTNQVYENIQEQISDYHPHIFIDEEPLDPHLPYSSYKNDELRIKIALNITIGQHTLVDNFDWDINNPYNSPEEFASNMAVDLSLSGEFQTAIAHSIREQAQLFTKSLFIAGHPFDGRPVEDGDIRENLLPTPLASPFRPFQQAKDYAPVFYELNDADLERQELVFSREQRQQKRSAVNRRGGPSLPALKDRLKTWRTMVVSSVIPGAAETAETSGIYRISRSSGRGRRPWKEHGEESDSMESGESDVDSPARLPLQGTSRTRGMRGAASAAQVAMRANLNARSATPELMSLETHTRAPPRKIGVYDMRTEDSDPNSFMIKLKLPRQKYRDWWRNYKAIRAAREKEQAARQAAQTPQQVSQQGFNGQSAPGAMGPPSTPGMMNRPAPFQRHPSSEHNQADAAASTPGPNPGPPPPPPKWLLDGLQPLREQWPQDSFEGVMRWSEKFKQWQPRIRCNDCPGTLYNTEEAGPAINFAIHLERAQHQERRTARLARQGAS